MRSTALLPVLSFLLLPACARTETVRPVPSVAVTSAPVPPARRSLYRLDFVLTTKDAGASPAPETFSYVVEDDGGPGEIDSGTNTPPTVVATPSSATIANPRMDVGLHVKSHLRSQGPNVLLDVDLEYSSAEPRSTAGPITTRKFRSTGKALVAPGKPATVVSFDEAQKHYDLAVTATQVR